MKYIVIDNIKNIEEYLSNSVGYKKVLNTYEIIFSERNKEFEKQFDKYIIEIDELSLEKMIINNLNILDYKIATAESCTGGLIISRLIGISGASNVINESYVTYANESKVKILGVKRNTIDKFGVQSLEVAEEMVEGLYNVTKADVCVSVTGYTTGDVKSDTDGIFYFGVKTKDYVHVEKECFKGTREEIRYQQATYILWKVNDILKKIRKNQSTIKYK